MPRKQRIRCQCGGRLAEPLPHACPHCGGAIRLVRRQTGGRTWPLLLIGLMFVMLLAYLWWWL